MRATTTMGTRGISRRFFVLGACGLLTITVIQVPAVADLWEQLSSQYAAQSEMQGGMSPAERVARLEECAAKVRGELSTYEQSMVGVEQMPSIQSELMDLARASGCQLRKAVVQAGSTETWEAEQPLQEEEDVEAESPDSVPASLLGEESPYQLTTEQLSLSLTGTLKQTFDFLDRVQAQPWLMRVAQINFSRDADGGSQLNVEANLAFYKLVCRGPATDQASQ